MGMAKTAELSGNNIEALAYFNRVLEFDPTNSEAWVGKGKAAGWQTTLNDLRVSEMLVAFNHAVATAQVENKESTLYFVTQEANRLIVTIYTMARNHMLEYVSLQNIWATYVAQMGAMVDALSTVHLWNPTDRTTLENIVHLCKDNIEGVSYRDQFENNLPKAWTLSHEYEAQLRGRMEEAASKLKIIDLGYATPSIEKKKAADCFVITATMGDHLHPSVRLLQAFRDEWLVQRAWGVSAVALYERYGPSVAEFISGSHFLRQVSFNLIVRPSVYFVRLLGLAKQN
jgi:hypothetical protein